jgi:TPR repeat protein
MPAASRATLKPCLCAVLACALLLMPLQAWASGVAARKEYFIRNYEAALRLARPAAEQRDDVAMLILGLMYYHGRVVQQDFREAFRWWKASAEAGNCKSQSNLGFLLRRGAGVSLDFAEAARWYQLSAAKNCPSGYRGLAEMYEKGHHFAKDSAKAIELYRKAEALFKKELADDPSDKESLRANIMFVTYKIKNLPSTVSAP